MDNGIIQIAQLRRYPNFEVHYLDLGDAIQVDCVGLGLLNYHGPLTPELEMEIHTNIIQALRRYGEVTTHDASEIGYDLELYPTKKMNRSWNLFETNFNLCIIFQKPIVGASAWSLRGTIELITATILAEAFLIR